jgi:cytochrome c oxidase cbb3-type subunit 2
MPAYKFLFEERATAGVQASYKAVHVPSGFGPAGDVEIVPTRRAEALVAYLQSLKDTYDYPTERDLNAPAAPPKEGAHH